MRRLCFGGAFNPIHHAHMICARAVAEAKGYETVELIPTAQPPHKLQESGLAPALDRFEMCKRAIEGSKLFSVNGIELNRQGPSYTIDTARELTLNGQGPVHWLIGADMLQFLPKWHQSGQLLKEVEFVVMARPGWTLNWDLLPVEYRHLRANVVEVPLIDISASQIRLRVARGLEIDYLTPEPVCRYIRERGLYR